MLQDLSRKHEESWSPFGRGTFSGADGSKEGQEGADTVSHPVFPSFWLSRFFNVVFRSVRSHGLKIFVGGSRYDS